MENKKHIKTNLKIIIFTFSIVIILAVLSIIITYNTMTTTITVSIEKDLSIEQQENIRKKFETICNTTDIEYVSKDEALQEMKDLLKEDAYLLDNYNENNNIFPARYIIKDIKFNKLSKIRREVVENNWIMEVDANILIKFTKFLLEKCKPNT